MSDLQERYELIPFCPEVEGGLPTPRPPSEIISQNPLRLINNRGDDVTRFFINGAKKCVDLVKRENIKKALLKANSPSCSNSFIYDGTFTNNKIKGDGVTVRFLKREGILVFSEEEIDEL